MIRPGATENTCYCCGADLCTDELERVGMVMYCRYCLDNDLVPGVDRTGRGKRERGEMCVGYRGIFRLPQAGLLGRRPMDRQYMLEVEERARRMKRVCRVARARKDDQENKQQELPL